MSDEVDIKNWILKIVASCNNTIHCEYTHNLIELYKEKCENESDYIEVQDALNIQYNKIHSIIS